MSASQETMTLNLPSREMRALERLCAEQDMNKTAVMRAALRLYQLIHIRLKSGETMSFSGDAARTVEFIGHIGHDYRDA